MDVPVRDHLMATLGHLTTRRARLVSELHEIEVLMNGLRREVESFNRQTAPLPFPDEADTHAKIFSGMSVRWSVLMYLAEHHSPLATVGIIAEALREGGLFSKGQNFNSNVSAVLSQMTSRGEVEKQADRFVLTHQGRDAWDVVRQSEKFRGRLTLTGVTADSSVISQSKFCAI